MSLAPIVVISVAGFSLASLYGSDPTGLTAYDLPIVDEDGGELARQITEQLATEKSVRVRRVESRAEAERLVASKAAGSALVIPAGTADALAAGRPARVLLYTDPVKYLERLNVRLRVLQARDALADAERARVADTLERQRESLRADLERLAAAIRDARAELDAARRESGELSARTTRAFDAEAARAAAGARSRARGSAAADRITRAPRDSHRAARAAGHRGALSARHRPRGAEPRGARAAAARHGARRRGSRGRRRRRDDDQHVRSERARLQRHVPDARDAARRLARPARRARVGNVRSDPRAAGAGAQRADRQAAVALRRRHGADDRAVRGRLRAVPRVARPAAVGAAAADRRHRVRGHRVRADHRGARAEPRRGAAARRDRDRVDGRDRRLLVADRPRAALDAHRRARVPDDLGDGGVQRPHDPPARGRGDVQADGGARRVRARLSRDRARAVSPPRRTALIARGYPPAHEHRVRAAERERARERELDVLPLARDVRHVVQVALGIGDAQVQRRRQRARAQREQRDYELDRARGSEQM